MCSHTATTYSGLSPPQATSTLQLSSFQLTLVKHSLHQACPHAPGSQSQADLCLNRAARMNRRDIFAWAEVGGTSALVHAGDVRSPTNLGHISLPALRMWCSFTKPEQLLVRPSILPLKCCACGTPTFLGVAFPSSLASASQRLSPSSSVDSSPLLSKSSSPADAFCPFKELSPVPAGFAGLASAVLAFQLGWQSPGSSCPSDAASVGKDERSSCSMQEEATLTHPHTCRKTTW